VLKISHTKRFGLAFATTFGVCLLLAGSLFLTGYHMHRTTRAPHVERRQQAIKVTQEEPSHPKNEDEKPSHPKNEDEKPSHPKNEDEKPECVDDLEGTATAYEKEGEDLVKMAWKNTSHGKMAWVQGLEEESCTSACKRIGLTCQFEDTNWPETEADVASIVEAMSVVRHGDDDSKPVAAGDPFHPPCTHFASSEQPFDPSISGSFCSHGPWKPNNVWGDEINYRPASLRSCDAVPPLASRRLCSCVEELAPLGCVPCDPSCVASKNCCWEPVDPCAKDPQDGKDPKYWGSATADPAKGVTADAWCQQGHPKTWRMPKVWPYSDTAPAPVHIKVLSYNLYWWHLFRDKHGNEGSAGKLIAEAGSEEPFDLMAFQECENPGWVLHDADMSSNYTTFLGPHATCVAFRNASWELLSHGTEDVAEDGDWLRNNYWSKRTAQWLRLRHISSSRTIFFMNHHGPLPLHSGGLCGGTATAYNLLDVISRNMERGDAVILVGDFNANGKSLTMRSLATQLQWVYQGKSFGGVDNFLTNMLHAHVRETYNYGGGGSDHDALGVMFDLSRHFGSILIPPIP
jgi:hypothetical protein